jgi:F0F1-type ATP synthase, epsilon subunit (mitochondrial delta subunit)
MADKKLTIRILTPDGTLHEGTASAVFLPGAVSPFEVLPDHAPIISALGAGDIRIEADGQETRFPVRNGMVRVRNNEITVCAEL